MVRSSAAALVAPVLGLLFSAATTTPVSALPAAAAVAAAAGNAARDANPGCTADSFGQFDWTVSDFVYNTSVVFSTPAHQIDGGIVQFNLTNPALAYPAVCYAYSTQLSEFFYGNIVYNCTVPQEDAAETHTTFSYNAPTSTLDVNQTWSCSDLDPTHPDTFTYAGTVNLTLACTSSSYVNPNWTMGEIYSSDLTSCTQASATIAPYLCEAEA